MKKIVSFLLLLQICSVSTDQTRIPAETGTPALQACPQDLHAVLRELTALLTQQKVHIEFLYGQNQVRLEKQAAEIDSLKQQLKGKQVAFSASLLAAGEATIGPFSSHTRLIFKYVVTNIGYAYNKDTGIFTAPVRGVYHFQWYIGVNGGSHGTAAVLFKNSEQLFAVWEFQPSHFVSAAQATTVLLEAGDNVSLFLWQGNKIYDNDNHHTTFSGHLLFTVNEGNKPSNASTV